MPRNRGPTRIELVTAPCFTSITSTSGLSSALAYIHRPSGLKTALLACLPPRSGIFFTTRIVASSSSTTSPSLLIAAASNLPSGLKSIELGRRPSFACAALRPRVHVMLDERSVLEAYINSLAARGHREPSRPLADLDRRADLFGLRIDDRDARGAFVDHVRVGIRRCRCAKERRAAMRPRSAKFRHAVTRS